MPVRVAIISRRSDLGAVTALWRKPRAHARFFGIELSLAYKGRLLVVMPNGFGFNWPGHPTAAAHRTLSAVLITPTGAGLASAAAAAVRALATAHHITIPTPNRERNTGATRTIGTSAARPNSAAGIVAILAVLVALVGPAER